MAPEMLAKEGHSFEVDIWSIGCILYTLLVGRPPFKAPLIDKTVDRITNNTSLIPLSVSASARRLIFDLLEHHPVRRPTIDAVLQHEFMTCGPLPAHLPLSCLTTPPRDETLNAALSTSGRKPLLERHESPDIEVKEAPKENYPVKAAKPAEVLKPQQPAEAGSSRKPAAASPDSQGAPQKAHLADLHRLLVSLISARPAELRFELEAEDPASVPVYWVTKWVENTDKYGLGYQLCDRSIAVVFNDTNRVVLLNNNLSLTYVDENNVEHHNSLDDYPPSLEKKMKLLKYFKTYMQHYLLTTGKDVGARECDNLVRLPCIKTWLRTQSAIAFYLTNGTVQINFVKDHTKLILCPLMAAVSYIDSDRVFHTYRLETLHNGCPPKLFSRLKYAMTILDRLASASS